MNMTYVKHETISLIQHPELNEKWVQDRISDEPSILGLGDLVLRDKERMQCNHALVALIFYCRIARVTAAMRSRFKFDQIPIDILGSVSASGPRILRAQRQFRGTKSHHSGPFHCRMPADFCVEGLQPKRP